MNGIPSRWRRRLTITAAASILAVTGGLAATGPAGAEAAVGYVRLAHFSPDTPKVDVYLSKLAVRMRRLALRRT